MAFRSRFLSMNLKGTVIRIGRYPGRIVTVKMGYLLTILLQTVCTSKTPSS